MRLQGCSHPGSSPLRRRQGRPSAGCHSSVPQHRDPRRSRYQADREEHHHPHQEVPGVLHRSGQPALRRDQRRAGREEDGGRQHQSRKVHPGRNTPARRGVPQIEVTFDIDANGIINVSAKDLGTGKEQKITIASSNKLSKEEIDAAIKNAEQFAEADKKKEELINARNQAETIVYTTKKTLDELGDKVTQEERTTVENAIKDLEAVQNSDNIDDIKAKTDAVMKAVEPISEKIYKNATPEQQQAAQQAYEQAQQQAQGNQSAGSSKKADDDNVIDADYKIVDDDDKN